MSSIGEAEIIDLGRKGLELLVVRSGPVEARPVGPVLVEHVGIGIHHRDGQVRYVCLLESAQRYIVYSCIDSRRQLKTCYYLNYTGHPSLIHRDRSSR